MRHANPRPTFIDLFAGCGGLSLGLLKAGWHGLFAVERDPDAFASLRANLIHGSRHRFDWPSWLPQSATSLEQLLSRYGSDLQRLSGKIDLLAGSPPCQGFSTFGRRRPQDPRNQLFTKYLEVVEILQPHLVLMENVRGIQCAFRGEDQSDKPVVYADVIRNALSANYHVASGILHAKDFGVPQTRPRFILIGIRKRSAYRANPPPDPFALIAKHRMAFLEKKGLRTKAITVREAISDLSIESSEMHPCTDNPRFLQGAYGPQSSGYQKLMHDGMNGALADSHRFANHKKSTVSKFSWLLRNCRAGKKIEPGERGHYANRKHTIYILDANGQAPTVTTLPDDMIHYSQPRILTVREMARLQSFPDWFEFKGKYTTGGDRRTKECPRYTQVGNAVPPLLSEAIGETLRTLLSDLEHQTSAHHRLNAVRS